MGYILHDNDTFSKDGHRKNSKKDRQKFKRLQKMRKKSKKQNYKKGK